MGVEGAHPSVLETMLRRSVAVATTGVMPAIERAARARGTSNGTGSFTIRRGTIAGDTDTVTGTGAGTHSLTFSSPPAGWVVVGSEATPPYRQEGWYDAQVTAEIQFDSAPADGGWWMYATGFAGRLRDQVHSGYKPFIPGETDQPPLPALGISHLDSDRPFTITVVIVGAAGCDFTLDAAFLLARRQDPVFS